MGTINLKIAELRKARGLTQQELGDILSVSYQTISKWENEVTLPDITILPTLAGFFQVSVDALLGLVPLGDEYHPTDSDKSEYWKSRIHYIKEKRKRYWNADYVQFLIEKVWHIDKPVRILDCCCGYGFLGLMLLPLLPNGSTYTGIDFTKEMLEEGKKLFAEEGLQANFILNDIFNVKPTAKYDIVISQAVLRHVNNGEQLLREMTEFLDDGGLLISMECNREFEADGLYIDGLDYAYLCEHEGLTKLWKTEYLMQNRDYAIAMKIPHFMRNAGLKNVDVRMNDRVTYLAPQQPDYEQTLQGILEADQWQTPKTAEQTEKLIQYFMNHGMSRKNAEDYCRQQNTILHHLKEHRDEAAMTQFMGVMISYGWKEL